MVDPAPAAVEASIVALPETSGSAIYGLVDVFASTGTLWRELVGEEPGPALIRPKIVALSGESFRCRNGIPVHPDLSIDQSRADVIVVPELLLSPQDDLAGRYSQLKEWLRRRHRAGATIYSACSGSVLLAASGLLDGKEATTHWGYADLFRRSFPAVCFRPEPNITFADQTGRIVTAGGATSWQDLAIHMISRHCSPAEALRVAKVFLLQWHGSGQLPYTSLARRQAHADATVRKAEDWLTEHFKEPHSVAAVVAACGVPERSFKRRFKRATGSTAIEYVQNLRVEAAKTLLESGVGSVDDIAFDVGYENPAFFRRLFKRLTGLTASEYRRMFRPISQAAQVSTADTPEGPAAGFPT